MPSIAYNYYHSQAPTSVHAKCAGATHIPHSSRPALAKQWTVYSTLTTPASPNRDISHPRTNLCGQAKPYCREERDTSRGGPYWKGHPRKYGCPAGGPLAVPGLRVGPGARTGVCLCAGYSAQRVPPAPDFNIFHPVEGGLKTGIAQKRPQC